MHVSREKIQFLGSQRAKWLLQKTSYKDSLSPKTPVNEAAQYSHPHVIPSYTDLPWTSL